MQYTYLNVVAKSNGTFSMQENNAIGQHVRVIRLDVLSKHWCARALISLEVKLHVSSACSDDCFRIQNDNPMFRHLYKFPTESRISPHDNVVDDSKTAPFEYCAVRRSVGWKPKAHKFFQSSNVVELWCEWCPR
ncbi:hypothetical protein TNCV_4027551 [Trichonephila clavipes]|nr:hypothetical protein TNCV_4027551 [Trichonephila clavipes]